MKYIGVVVLALACSALGQDWTVASLAVGFEMLLDYAEDAGAVTTAVAEKLWRRMWTAFHELAEAQDQFQQSQDPVRDGLKLLQSAIENKRVYVSPIDPAPGEQVSYPPNTTHLGYVSNDEGGKPLVWYFILENAYALIGKLYSENTRASFPLEADTFAQRLKDRGWVKAEEGRKLCRTRVEKGGDQPRFLCVPDETFRQFDAEENAVGTGQNGPTRASLKPKIPTRTTGLAGVDTLPQAQLSNEMSVLASSPAPV